MYEIVMKYYTDLSAMLMGQVAPSTKDQNELPSTAIDRFGALLFRYFQSFILFSLFLYLIEL